MEQGADARQVEVALVDLGSKAGNPASAIKITIDQAEKELLFGPRDSGQATLFRSALMRISYLALNQVDLTEALKLLSRPMVSPNAADFQRRKRSARQFVRRHRVVRSLRLQRMGVSPLEGQLSTPVDRQPPELRGGVLHLRSRRRRCFRR